MDEPTPFLLPARRSSRRLLILASLCATLALPGQPAAPVLNPTQSDSSMKTFVLIFRQATSRPRTDAERQRLAEEMGPWARRQNDAGHKLDPRILAPEKAHRGSQISPDATAEAWPVTALMFLEAHDLSAATAIAESHPGLRYGAAVEVRPWAAPIPVTPATAAPATR